MRDVLDQIKLAPLIVLQGHIVFRVNSLHFTRRLCLSQQRAEEKLREAVESLTEGVVRHLEVIVRVRQVRVGIIVAAVVANEFGVFVLTWVLLSAHEEHMLEEMSRAEEGLRVEGGSDMNIECCARFIGFVVLDKHRSEAVIELDNLVLACVTF